MHNDYRAKSAIQSRKWNHCSQKLIDAGLLEYDTDGYLQMHDWWEWQVREDQREEWREQKRKQKLRCATEAISRKEKKKRKPQRFHKFPQLSRKFRKFPMRSKMFRIRLRLRLRLRVRI